MSAFPGTSWFGIERRAGDADRSPVIVDPFFGGRVLDEKSLAALLKRVVGPNETLRPEHLEPAAPQARARPHAHQLESGVSRARRELARAPGTRRLVTLTPDAPFALRERGLLAARLGSIEVARTDLNRFLELTPDATDAKAIKARLAGLSNARHWLN